jgi:hypothetical protein
VILIDSNIPMYLVGAEHPNKALARGMLERVVIDAEPLVTDAEVLQVILHHYTAIGRRDAISAAFDALLGVVDEVFAVDLPTVEEARRILEAGVAASARDAIHVAVMRIAGIDRVMTFDRGFDRVAGIRRLSGDPTRPA